MHKNTNTTHELNSPLQLLSSRKTHVMFPQIMISISDFERIVNL